MQQGSVTATTFAALRLILAIFCDVIGLETMETEILPREGCDAIVGRHVSKGVAFVGRVDGAAEVAFVRRLRLGRGLGGVGIWKLLGSQGINVGIVVLFLVVVALAMLMLLLLRVILLLLLLLLPIRVTFVDEDGEPLLDLLHHILEAQHR